MKTSLLVLCGLALTIQPGPAAFSAEPTAATAPAPSAAVARWQESRFGLFLHWGLYSVAAGEWKGRRVKGNEHFMIHERVPLKEYAELATRFNPMKFDADAWVLAAKDAGMKYIVITAKHHEGFAMYDSPSSAYNLVKATPYGRDPMKALAEACRKHGLVFCFYYSLGRDWEDPDVPTNWPTKGGRSNLVDFPDEDKKVFSRYFERKVKPQVRELLTQYGPVGVMWFDTPELIPKVASRELREMIRGLQPDCIVNERIGNGMGDFAVAEQNLSTKLAGKPWESCITLSGMWGHNRFDDKWKSPEVAVRHLIEVASKGGNLLLNVGPTGEGELPGEAVERLAAIGRWMKVNGEAIYGTRAWRVASENPTPPATTPSSQPKREPGDRMQDAINDATSHATLPDLRFTAKEQAVYVLARSWKEPRVVIKALATGQCDIRRVELLGAIAPPSWEQTSAGLSVTLPADLDREIPIYTLKISLKE